MTERRHRRIDVWGDLRGEVMSYQPMTVNQISEGGARVDTYIGLPLDTIHQFRLTLGDLSIVVKGRIVYSRIARVQDQGLTYRSGIEFVDLSDHAKAALARFTRQLGSPPDGASTDVVEGPPRS